MALKDDRYTYRVTWSEDDQEYVGLCAEFPSLSWLARTPEAALKGIRKVVADVVRICGNTGKSLPSPLPPDATAANSWSGFLPKFIVIWPLRRPRPASA